MRQRSTCAARDRHARDLPAGLAAVPSVLAPPKVTEVRASARRALLTFAAANALPVRLLYRKPDAGAAVEIRTVTPTAVRDGKRGGRYVVAYDHGRGAERTFALSRIEGVVL
jgi:predicted DNA-binding transcriptional regulator YafY